MNINPVIVFQDDFDLVSKIKDFKGHSQASIGMSTLQKCTVKNRTKKKPDIQLFTDKFDGPIIKTSEKYISIGFEYQKSVNNRLVKEGKENDFESQSLPWGGEWFEDSKVIIIKRNGKGEIVTDSNGNVVYYLRYTFLNANGKASKEWFHYADGTEVKPELLDTLKVGFLPLKSKKSRQGTDDNVIVNAPKVSNIITLKFAGKTYVRKGYLTDEQKQQLTAWLLAVPVNDLEKLKVA